MRVAIPSEVVIRVASGLEGVDGSFVVGGGDPIRRSDSAELLVALARIRPDNLAICTAGDGLTASVVRRLKALGVHRVMIPFHCGRQDAHDWLVGRPGSLKVAHRAIRACVEAAMPVVAEVVLTRPTVTHLAETVAVLARIGVRRLNVRRLLASDANGLEFIPLSPRLELLGDSLERAAAVALERKMRLSFFDLPVCVAPRLRRLFAAPGSELWVTPAGDVSARSEAGPGCVDCPGLPECAGAPRDYVDRFGWEEFVDPATIRVRLREDVAGQREVRTTDPMVFGWRGPRRIRCETCGDAVVAPSSESTRVVRSRLVEAARYRPAVLRLVGADLLAHPQAAHLIYDALRLFPRVEVAGEISPVVDWSDLDLRRLENLARIDVALYGADAVSHDAHCGIPGAFAAAMRAVERLRSETEIPVGAYAILHDASRVGDFADAWACGVLPGEPRFRLSAVAPGRSPRGRGEGDGGDRVLDSSIVAFVESAVDLPPGPARTALLAVLPQCRQPGDSALVRKVAYPTKYDTQQTVESGRRVAYRSCGSDPVGEFEVCQADASACVESGCPGTAVGWHDEVNR